MRAKHACVSALPVHKGIRLCYAIVNTIPSTKGRILVIDDYPSILVAFEFYLPTIGYAAVTAYDGRSGLEALAQGGIDLVLVDMDMPAMGGVAFCQAVKGNPDHRHIPVIMMTGRVTREARERGLAAGAREVVTKPFDFRRLEALIADCVKPMAEAAM